MPHAFRALVVAAAIAAAIAAAAPTPAAFAQRGRIETDTVPAASLANRFGIPAQARVSIYLPPSYDSSPDKRYPVVYLLHGFGASDASWVRGVNIAGRADSLVSAGGHEMIVVMPNAGNPLGGSFYANSTTSGNWDDFIARDLPAYVDGKFRTLAKPESRGLAGHSMGGYGTMYLGMRHAGDVFGAMYAMSACCTSAMRLDPAHDAALWDTVSAFGSADVRAKAGFYARVLAAMSAAFAPDTAPLYFDPAERQGKINEAVVAKWNAHTPALMLSSSAEKLKKMRGIAFDIGLQDELVAPRQLFALDSAFARAGIQHTFMTYEGTHTSKLGERIGSAVLPFFSRVLVFESSK